MADARPAAEDDDFVGRPPGHLLNYPVEMRWEFTRRHPYYLGLWREVRRYHAEPAGGGDGRDRARGLAAKLALGALGVGGEPVPPETPFGQISGEDPAFLCGSLQPMTVRALAPMLMRQLSPECQQFLGRVLLASAGNARDVTLAAEARAALQTAALGELLLHPHPDLDKVTDSPLFFMHLGASQETIKEDANRQARLWKARAGKASPKVHTTKLKDYLAVWDRVEGWAGGGYDVTREKTLKQAAAATKKSPSTLHDQFRAAFQAIVGRPYSPALWWRTVGRMKLAQLAGRFEESAVWMARRRFARHQDRLVAATTLAAARPAGSPSDPVRTAAGRDDDVDVADLVTDIEHLLGEGRTDDQILEELGLTDPRSRLMLTYIRKKQLDLTTLLR